MIKKYLFHITSVAILAITVSCNGTIGILGYGGVPGSQVKTRIMDAALENSFLRVMVLTASYPSSYSLLAAMISVTIDGMVVPGLAGINDNESYTESSVNACEDKIRGVQSLLLGTWISALSCDLESVGLVKVGPINIGGN